MKNYNAFFAKCQKIFHKKNYISYFLNHKKTDTGKMKQFEINFQIIRYT